MTSGAPWKSESLEALGVPSMISTAEQRYLKWLGRTYWQGAGDVLEIGPWLGGSTVCLARGMESSGHDTTGRLRAVDNFVWREFMADRAALDLRPGESFEPQFVANLATHASTVVPELAQLPDDHPEGDPFAADARGAGDSPEAPAFHWTGGGIEVLFVDGAKSWTAMRHLLAETASSLQAGHSLIVCQDYAYWGGYWVPIAMAALGDKVEAVHRVAPGGTVTFRVTQQLSAHDAAALPEFADLAVDQGLNLLATAAAAMKARGWSYAGWAVDVARVRFLAHRGERQRAVDELTRLCETWPLLLPTTELDGARRWASEATNAPAPVVPHAWMRRVIRRALAGRR
ncbi:MAG TPA: class I SAM-dependent methyltransferase [Mycobacteriales bacterium]|nr:class I SAM-dependent methyltransferase [Mycobacteriales bacterium]